MRNVIFGILFFQVTIFMGQSADKGIIKMNLGTGLSIQRVVSNENLGKPGMAVPTHSFLSLEYLTHNRISLNLEGYSKTYLNDDSTITAATGGSLGLGLQYYFMNRPKSNAFIGTSVGGFRFDIEGTWYPDSSSTDTVSKDLFLGAFGVYNTLYIGANVYVNKHFGFYFKGGLTNDPMRMDYVNVDGEDLTVYNGIKIEDWKMLLRGGFISVGLTFKFGGKKNETETEK